jgi:PII-like signaling protein
MQLPRDGMLLRIYFGEKDRHGGMPLYEAIVQAARRHHLAGATVLRGVMGYGRSSRVHRANLLEMSEDLPLVVEIIDTEAKIGAFLAALEPMMGSGLVTTERITVIRYGNGAPQPA